MFLLASAGAYLGKSTSASNHSVTYATYALAKYLCQSCTIEQLARPIEFTTTVEEPGLTPHRLELSVSLTIPFFFFLFLFFSHTTYPDTHIRPVVTTQGTEEKRDVTTPGIIALACTQTCQSMCIHACRQMSGQAARP